MTTTTQFTAAAGAAADLQARLRATVEALCDDECLPRLPGTGGGRRAGAIIEAAFADIGLEPAGVDGYLHPIRGADGTNLVGRLPGPGRDRTILVTAHYDACAIDGAINPGADDNAAGVAAIIELARALRLGGSELGRNVVFVAFDAEEPPYFQGPGMGSVAFVTDPPFPLDGIDCVVNLDLIGHRIGHVASPEVADTMLILGAETNPTLGRVLDVVPAVAGIVPRRLDSAMFPRMSDHAAFEDAGIPFLFYSCGRDEHYHAATDTPDRLAYDKIAALVAHLVDVIAGLADSPEARFTFDAGGSNPESTVATLQVLAGLIPADTRIGARALSTLDVLAERAAAGTFTDSDRALARRLYLAFDDACSEPYRRDGADPVAVSEGLLPDAVRRRIADAAANRGRVIVLTGAGISAESGIPTYRGDGGRWTAGGVEAMNRATLAFFMRNPHESWLWNLGRRTEMAAAEPNAAHHAIARLEAATGDRFGLITQNIDRLHVAAGSSPERTIEIHGHLQGMRCSATCDGILPIPEHFDGWDETRTIGEPEMELLVCPTCGFATRPHVLWFDEMYDETHYRARTADTWAANAALCITTGTSGEIALAPRLATIAQRAGALLVDVNPNPNELRRLTEHAGGVAIEAPASVGMTAVVAAIEECLQ